MATKAKGDLGTDPGPLRESPEEIARMRRERRLELPEGADIWVFGYGSLMWRPGFPHLEVRPARLRGHHRRFCIYSHVHRGSPEVPGLVFGLERGGSCRGLAFRVPAAEGEEVMDYLYEREMVTGVYIPRWVMLESEAGPIRAATFIVDHKHLQYAGRLSLAKMAALVRQGKGASGACRDYLEGTVNHLRALGLPDRQLEELLRVVTSAT